MKEVKELLNKCDNCKLKECEGCEFTYTDIQKIKKYVESIELTNETYQVINELSDRRTKELEQKETILDKVTEYIKNYIDDKQNEYEAISESYICQTDEDEYIKEKELAIAKGQKQVLKNVLNIIEGEKRT